MKIAVMMRAIDQESGLHVYVENLIDHMLKVDHVNSYLLLYISDKWLGRFIKYNNAEEQLIRSPHKLMWDQIAVPYVAWREGADIIFNPKFSVPLISHCPVAMSLREPAWWAWPDHYPSWNAFYMRTVIPIYCRKSVALFPISRFVVEENRKYQTLPEEKIALAYPAPNEHFRLIKDDNKCLEKFSKKYNLPQQYILSVTRVDHPGIEETRSFFPGKNVETTVRAFSLCRDRFPHKLVIAGRRVKDYLVFMGLSDRELEDVVFLDFVPHEEMPALYNLADLFVIPSYYESYAQAMVEAMRCGCPVIASKTGACPEISGGAALLANPDDPQDFADKISSVLTEEKIRRELSVKSLNRSTSFDWEMTARIVLDKLTEVIQH